MYLREECTEGCIFAHSTETEGLAPYEIDRLLEDKTQPAHDVEIVRDATPSDLDGELLTDLLSRQKKLHPRLFAHFSDEDIAIALRILAHDDEGTIRPTLAGLLALGTYPQKFFPRLTVTFAAYPGESRKSTSWHSLPSKKHPAGPRERVGGVCRIATGMAARRYCGSTETLPFSPTWTRPAARRPTTSG